MQITLHKNARTTPAIRREIRESTESVAALAERYHLTKPTVRKWRDREDVADKSHRPHHMHTTLSPVQEEIVVLLRRILLLHLDDLRVVVREFINPNVSRSGLSRCLQRHGVSKVKDLIPKVEGEKKPLKTFKDYEPGFVHVDVKYLPQMIDEPSHGYLFVAIDRATRWVYLEILPDKTAKSAAEFLARLVQKAPFTIVKLLTDNGKEFTDRFSAGGEREPSGNHLFDKVCTENKIEHRLIKPKQPQTNGMVERFNGRIADILQTTRFDSRNDLKQTLQNYLVLYNQHIPQKNINYLTPIQAMKNWEKTHPHLFKKKVYNQTGLDT